MGETAFEARNTRSLSEIVAPASTQPLLGRIQDAGYELNAKGAEISLYLLKLSQRNEVGKIRQLCDAYITYCEGRGNTNAKKLLHFYSRVGDRYNEYMHSKRDADMPEEEKDITKHLVQTVTGYINN